MPPVVPKSLSSSNPQPAPSGFYEPTHNDTRVEFMAKQMEQMQQQITQMMTIMQKNQEENLNLLKKKDLEFSSNTTRARREAHTGIANLRRKERVIHQRRHPY